MVALPYFAPRRPPSVGRTSSVSLPPRLGSFLSVVRLVLENRPRKFVRTPRPARKHWNCEPSHTVPTKWSLYRPLLLHARKLDHLLLESSSVLVDQVKDDFRRWRSERSVDQIQEQLRQSYLTLKKFAAASEGGPNLDQIRDYRQDIIDKKRRDMLARVYRPQYQALVERLPKPIMTGRFLRPTVLNGPLPRFVNQPLHITMMMASRRKARDRRLAEEEKLIEQIDLLRSEGYSPDDIRPYRDRLNVIRDCFARDRRRERQVYSREMLDQIEAARDRRPDDLRDRKIYHTVKSRMDKLIPTSLPEEGSDEYKKEMNFWS